MTQNGMRSFYGPYKSPKFRLGDKMPCEHRGREVVVGSISEANIQWPVHEGRGPRSPILCGDLICAVKTESEIAVAFHWRVSVATVSNWRCGHCCASGQQRDDAPHGGLYPERLTPEAHAMSDEAKRTPEFAPRFGLPRWGAAAPQLCGGSA